jgi:hypothetical protein
MKSFWPLLILVLVFSPILAFAQPLESQVQISVSALVESQEPVVESSPATSIGINQATLQGILTTLGPATSVDVFFQYREKGLAGWDETSKETTTTPTTFSATIIGFSENTTYEFRAGVEWGTSSQQKFGGILEFTTSETLTPPSGAGPVLPPAVVVFEGRASPEAFLTIFKNGEVAATFLAESSGLFRKELTGVRRGNYTFGIQAEDSKERKSVTLSFRVSVLEGTRTTISGIFIPPTIELSSSKVARGEALDIFGQVFPESQVKIFISPKDIVKETIASPQGKWFLKLDTTSLEIGEYKVWAKAFLEEGEQSHFSQALSFSVLPRSLVCQGADLNFDGEVNLTDFSILLYFWHQTNPENSCADINQDGIVDLIDFSIMMYWWSD